MEFFGDRHSIKVNYIAGAQDGEGVNKEAHVKERRQAPAIGGEVNVRSAGMRARSDARPWRKRRHGWAGRVKVSWHITNEEKTREEP